MNTYLLDHGKSKANRPAALSMFDATNQASVPGRFLAEGIAQPPVTHAETSQILACLTWLL